MSKFHTLLALSLLLGAGTFSACCNQKHIEICSQQPQCEFQEAKDFLVQYMPEKDKKTLSQSYLDNNVRLALKAQNETSWGKKIPKELFLNNVLPYSSIHEEVDNWRPLFYQLFMPLVKNSKSPTEAAETLNREIWKILKVTYSPAREKPDQSPFHSMRINKASCTGLSIILVDACRAVGVPARFAGCNWRHKPGNHSWVEIWDDGWHHLGAEDAPKVDQAWFNSDVIHALPDNPRYAIYATSWKPTGTTFYGTWKSSAKTGVPAENVTERYLKTCGNSQKIPRLSIDLRDKTGARICVPLLVIDTTSGNVIARGTTHDNKFDLNNHFNFAFPTGTKIKIVTDTPEQEELAEYEFGKEDYVLQLTK